MLIDLSNLRGKSICVDFTNTFPHSNITEIKCFIEYFQVHGITLIFVISKRLPRKKKQRNKKLMKLYEEISGIRKIVVEDSILNIVGALLYSRQASYLLTNSRTLPGPKIKIPEMFKIEGIPYSYVYEIH
jgi:hypothetical protein